MPDPKDAWIYWEERIDAVMNEANLAREKGLIDGVDYSLIMNDLLACEVEAYTLEQIESSVADAESMLIKAEQKLAKAG